MLLNTYFQGKCTGIDTFDVFCSASSFVWNKKKLPKAPHLSSVMQKLIFEAAKWLLV